MNHYIEAGNITLLVVPVAMSGMLGCCVVDTDLVDELKWRRLSWRLERKPPEGKFYARASVPGGTVSLHRIINCTPEGLLTDHIDGDTLNNLRSNLRSVTNSQNVLNSRREPRNGLHRGVNVYGRRFRANVQGKSLGIFGCPLEAAYAVKARLTELDPIAGANYHIHDSSMPVTEGGHAR